VLSDVSNRVEVLNQALEEKDNKIERLQSIVAGLSTSIQHMKLDYEKNEKSRRLLFSMV